MSSDVKTEIQEKQCSQQLALNPFLNSKVDVKQERFKTPRMVKIPVNQITDYLITEIGSEDLVTRSWYVPARNETWMLYMASEVVLEKRQVSVSANKLFSQLASVDWALTQAETGFFGTYVLGAYEGKILAKFKNMVAPTLSDFIQLVSRAPTQDNLCS